MAINKISPGAPGALYFSPKPLIAREQQVVKHSPPTPAGPLQHIPVHVRVSAGANEVKNYDGVFGVPSQPHALDQVPAHDMIGAFSPDQWRAYADALGAGADKKSTGLIHRFFKKLLSPGEKLVNHSVNVFRALMGKALGLSFSDAYHYCNARDVVKKALGAGERAFQARILRGEAGVKDLLALGVSLKVASAYVAGVHQLAAVKNKLLEDGLKRLQAFDELLPTDMHAWSDDRKRSYMAGELMNRRASLLRQADMANNALNHLLQLGSPKKVRPQAAALPAQIKVDVDVKVATPTRTPVGA